MLFSFYRFTKIDLSSEGIYTILIEESSSNAKHDTAYPVPTYRLLIDVLRLFMPVGFSFPAIIAAAFVLACVHHLLSLDLLYRWCKLGLQSSI